MWIQKGILVEQDVKRRLVYGVLSLVFGILATRLALLITNKLLGDPEDDMSVLRG